MMDGIKKRRIEIIICLLLSAASLVVYLQLINCDFVNYDDELYLTKNPHIQAGITLKKKCYLGFYYRLCIKLASIDMAVSYARF